ncbi:hypothetical protein P4S83_17865 [Aneurinibacillus thermoaerophilus]|uniref:hypothetical protein n=1 Tax=Aneurinibacillus thermoaerophilus TaxID=143495 RepID=UPI002E2325CB|nr:hypothetical protein [Aneurinibacillus thermoaerophilus]MED0765512.1 hypothetical protein [Aneurinibacillus thermoaerophilus]
MTQMTIDDLLNQPGHLPVRDPNKVYAPFELYGMGIKWTIEKVSDKPIDPMWGKLNLTDEPNF